jgi:hypothetical protein
MGHWFHDWTAQKAFGHLYYIWWLTPEELALAVDQFHEDGPEAVFQDLLSVIGQEAHGQVVGSVGKVTLERPHTALAEHCLRCMGIVIEAEHMRYLRDLPGIVTSTKLTRASE